MFHRALASKIFEAFSISRWNDRIRPIELTEMDKHALKSVLTYFMGKMEEKAGKTVDWEYIVYGNIFALLKNIALSDIKAPIISEVKKNHPEEYENLNKWVVEQYKFYIEDEELLDRFTAFLTEKGDKHFLECKILKAAHKYSTKREFDIIKPVNELAFPEIHQIEFDLQKSLADFTDLKAAALLNTGGELNKLICTIEQLRCQTRWSQTPRIPKTSVLGHCMYVAVLAFFLSRESEACPKMLVNNFYTALFHDLPESVTRDIISPVKRATESLPNAIKEIEHDVCERELYPKIPSEILPDLQYLLGDVSGDVRGKDTDKGEFSNRYRAGSKITYLDDDEDMSLYHDQFDPINGRLIKVCDEIAAFMEAYKSIEYGISTYHLQDGLTYVRSKYSRDPIVQNLNIGKFFAEFN